MKSSSNLDTVFNTESIIEELAWNIPTDDSFFKRISSIYKSNVDTFLESYLSSLFIDQKDTSENFNKTEDVNNTATSKESINELNQRDLFYFEKFEDKIIYNFHHTDFEDGVINDIIKQVDGFFKKNAYMTIVWLNHLYSTNLKDTLIIQGILRLLTFIDYPDYRLILLPLIKASFNYNDSSVQEAAIMVAEQWRTKEVLEALETTKFASKWLEEYANKVINELRTELKL